MQIVPLPRRLRVADWITVSKPDGAAWPLEPGEYHVTDSGEKVLILDGADGEPLGHVPARQFNAMLTRRQVAYLSW